MLTFAIPPLAKNQRKSESELDAAWAADLPNLLADMFDLLSIGLQRVGEIRQAQAMGLLPPPPRFADVAQVAEAAAWHGLGWPAGLLTRALNALRADAAEGQLADDPIACRLRTLVRGQPGGIWRGSYIDLERALYLVEGPAWDNRKIPLRTGLARVKGPMRNVWGIEGVAVGRTTHARIFEFRFLPDAPTDDQ